MIDPAVATEMLDQHRLALVGASDEPKSFAHTIAEALRAHGTQVVPVNPGHATVGGETCYPSVTDVPEPVDGVVVMVPSDRSADVVRACIDAGVTRVWLFQGLGGGGAVSPEAVELCRANGIAVVDGACPLMFLEPVGWFHRMHRSIRRHRGAIAA
jgi:uncharacterized protein